MRMRRPRVRVIYPLICNGKQIARCLLELGDRWKSERYDFEYVALGALDEIRRPYHSTPLPPSIVRLGYKLKRYDWLRHLLERHFVATMRPGDVAYIWPSSSVWLYRQLRARGYSIVKEMINSEERSRRAVLKAAHERHGMLYAPDWDSADPDVQDEEIALSDKVFSPSPWATKTLLEAGVPESKIASSSYAWDPETFTLPPRERHTGTQAPLFLCVAHGSVRKGTLELLEAWQLKKSDAKLLAVGPIAPEIKDRVDALTAGRDDIELLGYTTELPQLYVQADAYVMLSYEEGSPIVAYMALAAGIPIIGTEPVASGIIEHGVHGYVCDSKNLQQVADYVDRIATEHALRNRMQRAAKVQSEEFTWEAVATRRVAIFEAL
jgi:glycosyltransferase involved in cell wall biosynthesis